MLNVPYRMSQIKSLAVPETVYLWVFIVPVLGIWVVEIRPSTLLKADADVEAGCGTVDPHKVAVGRAKPLPTNHEQWLRCGHCSSQFLRLWPLHRRQVTLFHLRLFLLMHLAC